MSLSTLLLGGGPATKGKGKAIDEGLDAIFRTSAATITPSAFAKLATSISAPVFGASGSSLKTSTKRKHDDEPAESPIDIKRKDKKKARISQPAAGDDEDVTSTHDMPMQAPKRASGDKKRKHAPKGDVPSAGSESVPGNPSAPESSHQSSTRKKDSKLPFVSESVSDSSDGEDVDPSSLVHESVSKKPRARGARRTKYVPLEETTEKRDSRTIFVGNVPAEAVRSRPLQKQLKRHILSGISSAKIESIRFRSIAFQNPTSKLPTSDDESGTPGKSKSKLAAGSSTPAEKAGRSHDRERAASWRESKEDKEEAAAARADEKKFLSASEKKKVAFIKGELHPTADVVNAYIVFAHPQPQLPSDGTGTGAPEADAEASEPARPATMDPYEAARVAVGQCDGTVFAGRTIRVDAVGKKVTADRKAAQEGDPKRTVFVGNLDFASKEEDLRVFFEGVVSAERGPPPVSDEAPEGEGEEASEPEGDSNGKSTAPASGPRRSSWVVRVRIVRDKETQLGKGFAYVQFLDRECVDEILVMGQDKLKFAKRKLRVQRCKTLAGGPLAPRVSKDASRPPASAPGKFGAHAPGKPHRPPAPIVVPKGDPLLGSRLASLSKDERKQAKATDADRVARRVMKKKAKMALVKAQTSTAKGTELGKMRKRPGAKKGTAKETKKRLRSDRSIVKKNVKK